MITTNKKRISPLTDVEKSAIRVQNTDAQKNNMKLGIYYLFDYFSCSLGCTSRKESEEMLYKEILAGEKRGATDAQIISLMLKKNLHPRIIELEKRVEELERKKDND